MNTSSTFLAKAFSLVLREAMFNVPSYICATKKTHYNSISIAVRFKLGKMDQKAGTLSEMRQGTMEWKSYGLRARPPYLDRKVIGLGEDLSSCKKLPDFALAKLF